MHIIQGLCRAFDLLVNSKNKTYYYYVDFTSFFLPVFIHAQQSLLFFHVLFLRDLRLTSIIVDIRLPSSVALANSHEWFLVLEDAPLQFG